MLSPSSAGRPLGDTRMEGAVATLRPRMGLTEVAKVSGAEFPTDNGRRGGLVCKFAEVADRRVG